MMNPKKIFLLILLVFGTLAVWSKDYKASLFGVRSDGVTLNTGSIQKAIDFISENGGGRLVFYVGRYLTGTVELKSNVTLQLEEGAVLVGTTSAHDYFGVKGNPALVVADGQQNIGITGKGVIEGQGAALFEQITGQVRKGYLPETALQPGPALIAMHDCSNLLFDQLNLLQACGNVLEFTGCKELSVSQVTVKSTAREGSKGLVLAGCNDVRLSDGYFETAGAELTADRASGNVTVLRCKNVAGLKLMLKNQ